MNSAICKYKPQSKQIQNASYKRTTISFKEEEVETRADFESLFRK